MKIEQGTWRRYTSEAITEWWPRNDHRNVKYPVARWIDHIKVTGRRWMRLAQACECHNG